MTPAPESHSIRYFALLYSHPTQQVILESLLGIEREVFESVRSGIDHHVAHSRLQWWREECERTAAGHPVHPLTRTLADALRSSAPGGTMPLPALAGLSGFVDVAVWDLASATFETRRELGAYCDRWAAAMFVAAAAADPVGTVAAGAAGNPSHALGTDLWLVVGARVREIELLEDLAREAHRGRLRLPLDEIDRVGADAGVLAKPPWPAALADILRSRHQVLRGEIARSLASVDRLLQPALRGLLVWTSLACRASQRAERALPDRLRAGRFDAMSDAWFAWRVARRASAGQFKYS